MKFTELAALLFVALWLQYITKMVSLPSSLEVEYKEVQKVKKSRKISPTKCKMFPKTMKIEDVPQDSDEGIYFDH